MDTADNLRMPRFPDDCSMPCSPMKRSCGSQPPALRRGTPGCKPQRGESGFRHGRIGQAMSKSALITGITGQDGSYLAEFLLSKGYKVHGLVRRSSNVNIERIAHLLERVNLIPGDLLDQTSLASAIRQSEPDEVYNLAAQSFVATSWNQP